MNKNLKVLGGIVIILAVVLIAIGLSSKNNVTNTTTQSPTGQLQTFPVTLTIEHPTSTKTYNLTTREGETAMAITEQASQQHGIQLSTKEFSFGKMVETIDGVSSDQSANKYWTLYINGQMSNVGASDYKLKSGDTITWKYGG